ncbi:MAG TPA: ABC transporter permease [Longimicrobium sp.]|nr:ABC transporter permease [Longimicrobium sp.]
MSETLVVMRREVLERVRSRSFVISTLLFPVFMAALFVVPVLLGGGGGERRLVLVDEAPAGVGDAFVAGLTAAGAEKDRSAFTYRVERVSGPFEQARERLNARVLAEEIHGYVHLPADVVASNRVGYRARNVSSVSVEGDIRRAASQAVQGARLRQAGLELPQVASLLRPVELQTRRVTERGEDEGNAESTFFLAYITGFLIYMLVFMYGINVMRSVLEEKTNRIVEVIVSSMKATHLMLGKILGVGAVALLQVGVWIAIALVASWQSDTIAARLNIPPNALSAIDVDPWVLLATLGFFLLGFLLYAALFAATGAAVNSEQEAQQYQTLVFMPLIASILLMGPVINDPLGQLATTAGLVPLSAPIIMPMRMAAAAVPATQVLASLVLLAVAVGFFTWLAGKIYRVGILSTGKKPTLRELARWLRAA